MPSFVTITNLLTISKQKALTLQVQAISSPVTLKALGRDYREHCRGLEHIVTSSAYWNLRSLKCKVELKLGLKELR
ncbi:MAG: hypothetical protein NPIRA04_21080 [Nitrospirales bacterium]|nr:MAG: hypothetical protein NPIRA04_21080 [Nitrospirales bacterium]